MTWKHLLAQDCLACNREQGWPMCKLCADLEDAEAAVTDDDHRRDDPAA